MKNKLKLLREFKKKKGFTLIELIVVIAVLGILVLLAAPKFLGYTNDAKVAQVKNDVKAYETVLDSELALNDEFIEGWEEVDAEELGSYISSNTLFNKKGEVVGDYELNEEYFVIPSEKELVKTNLKGDFIVSSGGEVFYHDENFKGQSGVQDDEDPEANLETDFMYTIADGEVTLNGYKGESSDVVVPNTIEDFPVTKIGESAFTPYSSGSTKGNVSGVTLTSVYIPSSVQKIENYAFQGAEVGKLTIKEGLQTIGNAVFERAVFTEKVILPKSLTSAGVYIFKEAVLPKGITLGSLESLGNESFRSAKIQSIVIPSTVKSIGDYAFQDSTLETVKFNEGLLSIANLSFKNAPLKGELILPNTLETIGKEAFTSYNGNEVTKITFGNSLKEIGDYAFRYTKVSTLTIPESVENIGEYAFAAENETIGGYIRKITLLGAKNMKQQAFAGHAIEELTIGPKVEHIGRYSFRDNQLSEIKVPSTVKLVDMYAFNSAATPNTNIKKIIVGAKVVEDYAFNTSGNIDEIVILDTVENIHQSAFNNPTVKKVTFGANTSILSVDSSAFSNSTYGETGVIVGPSSKKDIIFDDKYHTGMTWQNL